MMYKAHHLSSYLFIIISSVILQITNCDVHAFTPKVVSRQKCNNRLTKCSVSLSQESLASFPSAHSILGDQSEQIQKVQTFALASSSKFSHIKSIIQKRTIPIVATLLLAKALSNPILLSQSINSFFVKFPFIAAFCVCAFISGFADFIAQKATMMQFSKSSTSITPRPFEYKRTLAFFLYGGVYEGCVQEFIFNHIYPLVFGSGTDVLTVSKIVMFDMIFTSPLICLPVAYIIKGAIYNKSIMHSMKSYGNDINKNSILQKCWIRKLTFHHQSSCKGCFLPLCSSNLLFFKITL